jgi:hypothetical protein
VDLLSQLLQTNVESRDKINLLRKNLEAECNRSGGNENGSSSRSMDLLCQLHTFNQKSEKKMKEMIGLLLKRDAGHRQTDGNENASTSGREGANLEQSTLNCLLTGMASNYTPESITVIPEYVPQEPCLANSQGTEEGAENTPGVYDQNEPHVLEGSEECCLKNYLDEAKKELDEMEKGAPTPESEDGMVG